MVRLHIDEGGKVRTLELPQGEHLVGRSADASVRIEAPNVSRRHALLHVDDEGVSVEDLGSVWGTFVNGEKLEQARQRLVPAGALLHFAQVAAWDGDHEREAAVVSGPEFPDVAAPAQTLTWFTEESFDRGRSIRMLTHLFGLLREEGVGTTIEEEGCLFVRDWIDADRVCVRVADDSSHLLDTRAWWSRVPCEGRDLLISQSIVHEALQKGHAVIWSGPSETAGFDPHLSWQKMNISSAAAVPIRAEPDVRGVLYVDRLGRGPCFDRDDLEVLVAAASAIATKRELIISLIERREAARIQLRMLPQELPAIPGYEVEKDLRLCRTVGGDLYDYVQRPDGTVLFLVADVCGKGIRAALVAAGTSLLFRALANLALEPLEIYERLHENLGAKLADGQFVALFLGLLEPVTGHLRAVVAGIPFPLIVRADGSKELLEPTALPAALTDLGPPATERELVLAPGDMLAVYSDGYPEAMSEAEEQELGLQAVVDCIVESRARPLSGICESLLALVDDFVGTAGASDDQTLFLLRRSTD